jgi:hypothetical protein
MGSTTTKTSYDLFISYTTLLQQIPLSCHMSRSPPPFLAPLSSSILLLLNPLILLGRPRLQLKGMDAALLGHLVLQQCVYQAMPGGLHLGLEDLGRDDDAEVRLLTRAALHRLVVRVQV